MASSLSAANLFSVQGLVAVITGGGTGIGLMMARALAANGAAKVYILGRRQEVLQEAVQSSGFPDILIPIVTDVTSKESLEGAVKKISAETGFINVLVANAGQTGPRHNFTGSTIDEFQAELWKPDVSEYVDTFAANTAGVWYTIVAFLKLLDEGNKKGNVSQSSQVISTGSVGGFNRKTQGNYAYAQSKAALTHLTKQLATRLIPYGIRSNMIAPGLYPAESAAEFIKRFENIELKTIVPVNRLGTEEDMAGCILYLTSRAGGFLSGCVIVTDGGSLSILPSTY